MKKCKFCGKEVKRPSQGYCVTCYQYFVLHGYDTWCPSDYGQLNRVMLKTHKQYGWPICHICGKAFTKLQQHIWYAHNLTKNDYCDLFGIDRNINMTSAEYNKKMSDYAYKYNMPQQLKEKGQNTRFKKGHSIKYERSAQTKARLKNQGVIIGEKYGGKYMTKTKSKTTDPIKIKIQNILQDHKDISNSNIILKMFLTNYDCKYWIYEASKSEILNDILNKQFSSNENYSSDWVYILANEYSFHYIGIENCSSFDLNILFRNDFKYMYKLAVFLNA